MKAQEVCHFGDAFELLELPGPRAPADEVPPGARTPSTTDTERDMRAVGSPVQTDPDRCSYVCQGVV